MFDYPEQTTSKRWYCRQLFAGLPRFGDDCRNTLIGFSLSKELMVDLEAPREERLTTSERLYMNTWSSYRMPLMA